jgi:hypothetical protein
MELRSSPQLYRREVELGAAEQGFESGHGELPTPLQCLAGELGGLGGAPVEQASGLVREHADQPDGSVGRHADEASPDVDGLGADGDLLLEILLGQDALHRKQAREPGERGRQGIPVEPLGRRAQKGRGLELATDQALQVRNFAAHRGLEVHGSLGREHFAELDGHERAPASEPPQGPLRFGPILGGPGRLGFLPEAGAQDQAGRQEDRGIRDLAGQRTDEVNRSLEDRRE